MAGFKWQNRVYDHGPTYALDRVVLLVLVDFMRDDGVAWPSMATIANRAGLQERATRNRIRALERDGWLTVVKSGGGRHIPNRYRVNLERLSTSGGVSEINPALTRHEKPGLNPARETENPASDDRNPARDAANPLEPLEPAVVVPRQETVPGLLVALANDDDDEQNEKETVRVALHGIVSRPTSSWRKLVLDALARGWTASALNAHVHERMAAYNGGGIDPGLARVIIRDDEPPTAAQRQERREPCDTCRNSGWLENEHGDPVARCPDCHPKAATG